jgi:DUF971 family protein
VNTPSHIALHRKSKRLELHFGEQHFTLPAEYLRVYSPSAEVRGHGPGQEVLQTGKADVGIRDITAIGHYAIQLVFDDGHDTGIYTWDYLYALCTEHRERWEGYLLRLQTAGASRHPDVQVIRLGE